ncbi:pilus assembly protein PilM [bacterium]|nr:pilus assembly protein PilM [bacterium]
MKTKKSNSKTKMQMFETMFGILKQGVETHCSKLLGGFRVYTKEKTKTLWSVLCTLWSNLINTHVITGIEIGQNSIKVVQGISEWKKSRIKIITLLTEEIKNNDEKQEKLKHIINNLMIKPKKVIACIPRSLVTVRYLNLPSTSEREIAHMVQFQAEKQLPYSKEELVTAFKVIGSNKDGYSRVMLVLVHQDVINNQLKLLGDLKLNPEYIELSSQATASAFIKEHPGKNKAVAFIDIDIFSVDIQVIFNGELVYTRNISLSENRRQESLLEEITKSLNSYNKDNKEITSIFISGKVHNKLMENLSKSFEWPVEIFNPVENLALHKEKFSIANQSETSLCSIVGLIENFPNVLLNVLPDEIKTQKQVREKRKNYLVLASQCIGILFLILSVFMRILYDKQNTSKWLDIEIKKTNPIAKEVNKRAERLRVIKEQIDTRNSCLDILHELHKIIPDTISLSTLDYQLNNTLKIKGQSKALSDALGLIDILEKSSYFKNVQLKSSNMRRLRDMEVADFYIQCEIES